MPSKQLRFDEINQLDRDNKKPKAIPYDRYFGEMALSSEQKSDRISLAKTAEDKVLGVLALLHLMLQNGGINKKSASAAMENAILASMAGAVVVDSYLLLYAERLGADLVESSIAKADTGYTFTLDRAMVIAENLANAVYAHDEFADAIREGYTHKTWRTMEDNKVRDSHVAVNGVTVGILDYFQVGDSLLLYPCYSDVDVDPAEVVNCRCTIKYS